MDRWADLVGRIAAACDGLVLTTDLATAGLQPADVRSATRGLFRIRRGAYAVRPPRDDREHHALMARAVVAQHDLGVVLSHTSAADLLGLPVAERHLHTVHLSHHDGIRPGHRHGVHSHLGVVGDREVMELGRLPVTAPLRTVVDCSLLLPLDEALAIADHTLHRGQVHPGELGDAVAALPRGPGVRTARRVALMADGRSESPGETRTRLQLIEAGWDVEPQAIIRDREGLFVGRVDFLLRETPIVVEFDGRAKYGLDGDVEGAHWREKLRHDRLNDAGYVVVRVVWRDLFDPGSVPRKVTAAASRARRLGLL